MARLKISHVFLLTLPVIVIAGISLLQQDPIPLKYEQPPQLSEADVIPADAEKKSSQVDETEPKQRKQTTRPLDRRISPSQRKENKSSITDYFKKLDKPTPQEREAERLAKLDLPTLMKEKKLKLGSPVFIRAFKEERELELFVKNESTDKYELLRTYRIAAASGVLGPKLEEGDNQVPEGFYFSSQQSMKPDSDFHLAFNIGYPNAYDRAHGRTGSFIMVHGSNVSIGCLAMTDEKIEEIYTLCQAALDAGQPFFRVHVFPFRMTEERMQQAANDPWFDFWKNLKTGYDLFEKNRIPPNTGVKNKQYTFD